MCNNDKASDLEQFDREQSIRHAAASTGKAYKAIGKCNYCRTPFDANDARLFCDGICATDQAKEDEADKRKRGNWR